MEKKIETNVLEKMAPIWKQQAKLPVVESTLFTPDGRYLAIEEVSNASPPANNVNEDDSCPLISSGMTANDVLSQCGYVLVRRNKVEENEKNAVANVLKSPMPVISKVQGNSGYYSAPSLMTQDMILLDIIGYDVLSKASVPNSKSVMPTFHGTLTVKNEDKDEILYLPSMAAVPVGIIFFTEGTLKILRAPHIYEEELDDADEDTEEKEPQRVVCAKILDDFIFSAHADGKNKNFGACSAVGDEIKEELEKHGDEIWTTLNFKPHDILTCLRGTLFKLQQDAPNNAVSGKLLATINNPIPSDASAKDKYSRISDVHAALTTGIIKRDRWGVPFFGENPPKKLTIGLDDVLINSDELEEHFPRVLMLQPPFHRFTTDRSWSNGFPQKFFKKYNDILEFTVIKKEFPDLMKHIIAINKEAEFLKKNLIIAGSKIQVLERAYLNQESKFLTGKTLSLGTLSDKLTVMRELIQKAVEELEMLRDNSVKREKLKVNLDAIIKNVEEENIDAKSIKKSIISAKRKLESCRDLPSNSRLLTLSAALESLEKCVEAGKQSKEKKEEKKRKREELLNTNNDKQKADIPDPDVFEPASIFVDGPKLLSVCNEYYSRYSKLASQAKKQQKTTKKQKLIASAKNKIIELRTENEEVVIDPELLSLANTELSESEKIILQQRFNEDKYIILLKEISTEYQTACNCVEEKISYDSAKLDWMLDRLECWPENPFIANNKIDAEPGKKRKYYQTTLFGNKVQESVELSECPNDDDCENMFFISENARIKLHLESRCLICEAGKLANSVQQGYNKLSSAYEKRNPLLDALDTERWEKITFLMQKVEKFLDHIHRCPAVKKTKSEPKSWASFVAYVKTTQDVLNRLPLQDLPEPTGVYTSTIHDENFVPQCDQYQSEACALCDGLLINGVCVDDCQEEKIETKSKKKRSREWENAEEETHSTEYHIKNAIKTSNDPVLIEALKSSLKRLDDKNVEYVERFAAFIAHNEIIVDGEMEFDKTTAVRFGTKDFLNENEAQQYASETWGYDCEKQPFLFFEKITTTKK